eukprot:jgi/Mesvir1/10852/Mv06321-RA.1
MPPNRSRRTSTRSTSARARPRKAARKTVARKNPVARTRTSVRRGIARRRTHTTRADEFDKFDRRIGDYDDARVQRLLNEFVPTYNNVAPYHAKIDANNPDDPNLGRLRRAAEEIAQGKLDYNHETAKKRMLDQVRGLIKEKLSEPARNPMANPHAAATELAALDKVRTRGGKRESERKPRRRGKGLSSREARAERGERARRAEKEAQKEASRVHESVAREEPRRAEGVAQPRQPVSVDRAPVAKRTEEDGGGRTTRQVVSVAPGPAARVVDEPGDGARGAGAKSGDRANAGARKAGRTGRGTLEHEYDTWVAGRRLYATRDGRPGKDGRAPVKKGERKSIAALIKQGGRVCGKRELDNETFLAWRNIEHYLKGRAHSSMNAADYAHLRAEHKYGAELLDQFRKGNFWPGAEHLKQVCLLHRETPRVASTRRGKRPPRSARARPTNARTNG